MSDLLSRQRLLNAKCDKCENWWRKSECGDGKTCPSYDFIKNAPAVAEGAKDAKYYVPDVNKCPDARIETHAVIASDGEKVMLLNYERRRNAASGKDSYVWTKPNGLIYKDSEIKMWIEPDELKELFGLKTELIYDKPEEKPDPILTEKKKKREYTLTDMVEVRMNAVFAHAESKFFMNNSELRAVEWIKNRVIKAVKTAIEEYRRRSSEEQAGGSEQHTV